MLLNRFAVIDTFPNVQNAETECIARIKNTAALLGLECIPTDGFARPLDAPNTQLSHRDVDFAIALHFSQPKQYDIFSFVALWNPTQFLHDWGYRRSTEALLSHDDFLTCASTETEDHILRSLHGPVARPAPRFELYPSVPDILHPPSLGDRHLFYSGINWDRVIRRAGRHDDLLQLLDRSGRLRVFGPRRFQNVDVWRGFRGYSGPLPFDGTSVPREIHRAGAALVISSPAHRRAGAMSMRLFESVAAGASVLCDNHPFALKFFGDSLLYFDPLLPPAQVAAQILSHLDWIDSHPQQALDMTARAQQILASRFTYKACLQSIYAGLPERRRQFHALLAPPAPPPPTTLFLLIPEFSQSTLDLHLANIAAAPSARTLLCCDPSDLDRLHSALPPTARPELLAVPFFDPTSARPRPRRPLGAVLLQILQLQPPPARFAFVAPNERIFSSHLPSLELACAQAPPDSAGAFSKLIRPNPGANPREACSVSSTPELAPAGAFISPGLARFLFNGPPPIASLQHTLPYLDALAVSLLASSGDMAPSGLATAMITPDASFHDSFSDSALAAELDILADRIPLPALPAPLPLPDTFAALRPESLTRIAVLLAHSIPLPSILRLLVFGPYRLWLHLLARRRR